MTLRAALQQNQRDITPQSDIVRVTVHFYGSFTAKTALHIIHLMWISTLRAGLPQHWRGIDPQSDIIRVSFRFYGCFAAKSSAAHYT